MSFKADEQPNNGFKPAEALEVGTYPARLVGIMNMGLQKQEDFVDPETKEVKERNPVHVLNVTYELADEFLTDDDGKELKDKPRHISERFNFYPLSSQQAKSTSRYKALDPDLEHKGDWEAVVGNPVQIALIKGKPNPTTGVVRNYIKDTSAMRAKDVEKMPPMVNEPKIFDAANPDMELYWSTPEWLQNILKEAVDYEGSDFEKLVNMGRESAKKEAPVADISDLDEKDW